ncbi:uncharacterized protein LOC126664765 [Mercurialis annua]|uniref:uncharacterized protein LOC126664765 n=1 Tax=Mercurialis annua TaxID=3986 RepID=UPI00215E6E0C|nr:uncharacterized protein LOC126664765 [Mercurialis annua]
MPKLKSLSGAISPINTQFNNNENSALIKYFCSGGSPITSINNDVAFSSPEITTKSSSGSNSVGRRSSFSSLSSIQNVMMMSPSPSHKVVYRTPTMKVVDDDVLVMDGVLVENSSASSKGSNKFSSRYKLMTSDHSSFHSCGSSFNSGNADPTSFKSELCRSWENFGHCRYGSKCQFAHGQEEVRPACFNYSESSSSRSYAQAVAPESSTSPLAPRDEGIHMSSTVNVSEYPGLDIISPDVKTGHYRKQRMHTNSESSKKSLNSTLNDQTATDNLSTQTELPEKISTVDTIYKPWFPSDDGIECALPGDESELSKEEFDAHVQKVLYDPSTRKRLSVFAEFCQNQEE